MLSNWEKSRSLPVNSPRALPLKKPLLVRAQNNSWSMDNVWPGWPFVHQTFTLLVILTRSATFSGPHFHTLHFNRTSIFFQLFTSMSLLVRLACSYYYGVIFKILTGQKRDLTELKFLWPVNTTGNSPKFILSPTSELLITSNIYFFVFICFIIASYFHPISLVFSSLLKMKVLFWNFSSNYRKISRTKEWLSWGTDWKIMKHYFIPANFFWDISVRFLSWECWDFWRRHDHFRRFPKKSEDVRSLPKTSKVCQRRSYRVPVLG